MATWTMVPQVRNGVALGELVQVNERSFHFLLNRASTIEASIPVSSPTARRDWLTPGQTELKVYRDSTPLETVFACTSAHLDTDADAPAIQLGFQGIFSYLQDATVYGSTTAYSGTTLPWSFVNTFQGRAGGNYGIVSGVTTGSATSQTRTIEQDEAVSEAIIALAEYQSGFDFAIDTNRALNLWYPKRGSDTGLVLEWGTNVRTFGYDEEAGPGTVVSDARVTGGVGGSIVSATNAATQATYGRREVTRIAAGEALAVTDAYLQTEANTIVAEYAAPLVIPNVVLDQNHPSVAWGLWWLGDIVTFRAQLGQWTDINAKYRIVAVHVTLDDNDNETISFDLNLV